MKGLPYGKFGIINIYGQKQPIGINEMEDPKKLQLDPLLGSKHGGMS
jgi:hypothetical protein